MPLSSKQSFSHLLAEGRWFDSMAIESFVEYDNHQRYHEALDNVAPANVYLGRKDGILGRRKEVKQRTLQARKEHNRKLRELDKKNSTG